ncbi:MAG: hypothetical protein HFE77_01790 [Clostridiales bacterium]|nr:hypothetical protein [Clostridiales bacterium]
MAKWLNGVDDETMQRMNAPYSQSDEVNQKGVEAQNAYFAVKNWQGSGKAQAALDKWKNTGPFSYDPDSDSLFQSAKANAIANGKVAMQDTIGQASALTGGYGNSYATTAGSQAYQNYLKSLDDDLATYYQLALDQYQQNKNDLLTEYSIESERDDTDYSRLYNAYNVAQDRYNTDRSFDYGKWADEYQQAVSMAGMQNQDYWTQKNFDEEARRWQANYDESKRQFDANLAESQRQYDQNYYASTSSGSGGKSNGFTSQQYWDVTDDAKNIRDQYSDDPEKANQEVFRRANAAYNGGQMSDDEYISLLHNYIDGDWLERFTITDNNGNIVFNQSAYDEYINNATSNSNSGKSTGASPSIIDGFIGGAIKKKNR